MLMSSSLLLILSFAVGLSGTRTALHIRHAKSGTREELLMLTLCWSPFLIGLLALLLSLSGSST